MRGTGIDSDVEIYATKQSNEHQYMFVLLFLVIIKIRTMDKVRNPSNSIYLFTYLCFI
jgi:hypothetical protein